MTNNISFPKMGIELTVNNVAFTVGSKEIYWYAIIILSGFLLGLLYVCATCEKQRVKKDNVWDIALYGLIAGIVGARTYYVIFALDEMKTFSDIFKIWNGGLAIYGGIIGAFLSTFVYCRVKKLEVLRVFDVCAPGLLIGQAIGRFGNFVNAEVFGKETNLPWGMSINGGAPVHPLFLYESLWNLLGLLLIVLFKNNKRNHGQVVCFYVLWYAVGRFFLESMRNQEFILYIIPDVLAASQLVAAISAAAALAGFMFLHTKKKFG